jgi:hypothetical protein
MKYIPLMAGPPRPSKLRTRDLNNLIFARVVETSLIRVPIRAHFPQHLKFIYVPRVLNSELPERFHFLPTRQIREQLTFSKASAIKPGCDGSLWHPS